ncbi:MAG: FAD-dependent oxidoreductase [Victivallales bacterium]|nr:FAD-dependent oxidoreductase [Victivallales bacterium]
MRVGIIGAGPAGVAAAQVIAGKGVEVTLFSAEKVLPYYRPRLPELAFGNKQLDNIFMHKLEWYAEKGIDLRLDSKVKTIKRDFEISLKNGSNEKFDALVIAIGGGPVIPDFCKRSSSKNIFPLWTYSDALHIREQIKSNKKIAVIGGGVIGIEAALRAEDNDLRVVIIEKTKHLMSRNFAKHASELIEKQLRERNVDLLLDNSVTAVEDTPDNKTLVVMEHENGVTCNFVVLSLGAGFDTSLAYEAGIKTDRKILVDKNMQTSSPGIFAAGDIAQFSRPTACSAKESLQQGKTVGLNVLAYLNNEKMKIYEVQPVPVRFKYKDFEIYSIGKVPKIDDDEKRLDADDLKVYRACIYEGSVLAGVQMVGSNKDIRKYQEQFLLAKAWENIKGVRHEKGFEES